MIIETSRKAEHIEWFLTDVLLFTHLVHLPAAYASKPYKYYELFTFHVGRRISHKVCDHFKYYAMRMLIEINYICFLSAIG